MGIVLTSNAKFNPYTFDEVLKPLAMATDYYNTMYDKMDEIQDKAALLKAYANENPQGKVANTYNSYMKSLEQEMNSLVDNGLTPRTRQRLSELKKAYSSQIRPIENAIVKRDKLAEEQRQLKAKDPSYLFERIAKDIDLQEFIDNPSADYGKVFQGNMITAYVKNFAQNFAKEVIDTKEGKQLLQQILPLQYKLIEQRGFRAEDILNAFKNPETMPEIMNIAIQRAIGASGVTKDWSPGSYDRAMEYAKMGLPDFIGGTSTNIVKDDAGFARLNADLQDRNNAREHARKLEEIRASKEKGDDNGDGLMLSSISFLDTSNKSVSKSALKGLKKGQDSLDAAVFGKNGKVNPLHVYREYQKILNNIPQVMTNREEIAMRKVMEKYGKYGIKRIITAKEAKALEELDFDNKFRNGITHYSQLDKAYGAAAKYKSAYSVNLTDYKYVNRTALNNLNALADNNNLEGNIYKVDSTGKKGQPITDLDDLELYDKDGNLEKEISDVLYYSFEPDYIMIQLSGKKGGRYYVSPSIFGSEVENLIRNTKPYINDETDKTAASIGVTSALNRMFNSVNPIPSGTDSNLD